MTFAFLVITLSASACLYDGTTELTGNLGDLKMVEVWCSDTCIGVITVSNPNPEIVEVIPDQQHDVDSNKRVFLFDFVGVGSTTVRLLWACEDSGGNQWEGYWDIEVRASFPYGIFKPDSMRNSLYSGWNGEPVNTFTGELFMLETPDLNLGGPLPLYFRRFYASGLRENNVTGRMGANWRHNFEHYLFLNGRFAVLIDDQGRVTRFEGVETTKALNYVQQNNLDTPYQLVPAGSGVTVLLDQRTDRIYTFDSSDGPMAGLLLRIEDGKGNTLTLAYDVNLDLEQVSDGLGRSLSFTHPFPGHSLIGTVTDQNGREVSYEYDGDGSDSNLIRYTNAEGKVTEYVYHPMTAATDWARLDRKLYPLGNHHYSQTFHGIDGTFPGGRVETQTDGLGNMGTFTWTEGTTTMTDPLDGAVSHMHNEQGCLTEYRGEDGASFTLGYDDVFRRNRVTDRLGAVTAYTHHGPSGKLASATAADLRTKNFHYTARPHPSGVNFFDLTRVDYPDGTYEEFTYDPSGNVSAHRDQAGGLWTYEYDAHGQVTLEVNPEGGRTEYGYNPDATLAFTEDDAGNTWGFGYDTLGRMNAILHPDGTSRGYVYDAMDRPVSVTDERGHSATFGYDDNGNLVKITGPYGNVTGFSYDLMDRVISMTDPTLAEDLRTYDPLERLTSYVNKLGDTTSYGYDIRGRITEVADPAGKAWQREYDLENIPASSTDPLAHTESYESDDMGRITEAESPIGNTTWFTYDAMGRVIQEKNPLSETTTYAYDSRGLVEGIGISGGYIAVSYTRNGLGLLEDLTDPNGNVWSRGYDPQGRPASWTDPLGNATEYHYDVRSRVSRVDHPASDLKVSYDGTNNVVRLLYSDTTDLGFTYDDANRLTAADGLSLAYDPNGRIIDSNGIQVSRDALGNLSGLTLAPGKTITYVYNSRNLLEKVTDWVEGEILFAYDDAGRLTGITRPNGVTTTYTYDGDGNLTGLNEGSLSFIALTRDAAGQVESSNRDLPMAANSALLTRSRNAGFDAACQVAEFAYDAMGRCTGDGVWTYSWDQASRLRGYEGGNATGSMSYDGLGMRIGHVENGVARTYLWNYAHGLPSVNVVRGGSSDLAYYVYSPAGALLYAVDAATGERRFYHFDEMGNTLFLTDGAGEVTAAFAYDPYGRLLAETGEADNCFTWQGQFGVMRTGQTGLYYMRARYYDSGTGRFLSRDPAEGIGPKSVNPYAYAYCNPQRYTDPTGKRGEKSSLREFWRQQEARWKEDWIKTDEWMKKNREWMDEVNARDISNREAPLIKPPRGHCFCIDEGPAVRPLSFGDSPGGSVSPGEMGYFGPGGPKYRLKIDPKVLDALEDRYGNEMDCLCDECEGEGAELNLTFRGGFLDDLPQKSGSGGWELALPQEWIEDSFSEPDRVMDPGLADWWTAKLTWDGAVLTAAVVLQVHAAMTYRLATWK